MKLLIIILFILRIIYHIHWSRNYKKCGECIYSECVSNFSPCYGCKRFSRFERKGSNE